jgi:hypothetical protein
VEPHQRQRGRHEGVHLHLRRDHRLPLRVPGLLQLPHTSPETSPAGTASRSSDTTTRRTAGSARTAGVRAGARPVTSRLRTANAGSSRTRPVASRA